MSRPRDSYEPEYLKVRPQVLLRDHNRCVKCGSHSRFEVHHVYGYEDNNPAHLQTLCYSCHLVAPMGEEYWDWLERGVSGESQVTAYVLDRIRKQYSHLTDMQFRELLQGTVNELVDSSSDALD